MLIIREMVVWNVFVGDDLPVKKLVTFFALINRFNSVVPNAGEGMTTFFVGIDSKCMVFAYDVGLWKGLLRAQLVLGFRCTYVLFQNLFLFDLSRCSRLTNKGLIDSLWNGSISAARFGSRIFAFNLRPQTRTTKFTKAKTKETLIYFVYRYCK